MSSISTKSDSRPPSPCISSEQAFLETYFLLLSQFGFDKAKDSAEKECTSKKGTTLHGGTPWFYLLSCLGQLALVEKTYCSLSFVTKKRFRRDSLLSGYHNLGKDFEKVYEICTHEQTTPTALQPEPISYGLMAELARHLNQFVQARQECMKFYETLGGIGTHATTNTSAINYHELVTMVENIRNTNAKLFHHPILDPIKSSFSVEMDLLYHLLKAQCDLVDWKFLPSLLHLYESKTKLLSWNKVLPPSSVKDSFTGSLSVKKGFDLKLFGSGSRKQIEVPPLFQWLARFFGCLVSKFTLYFHSTLSEQSTSPEMKALTAKNSIDYVTRIASFQRRADAEYVCLTLNTKDLKDSYKGPGYHLPNIKVDAPTGIHSYPAIFCYPSKCPTKLWPDVVTLIQDRDDDLTQEKLVHFYDTRGNMTYFLTSVDKRMTLVAIFKGKKNERDSYVGNFFNDTACDLRNTKILNFLKIT